MTPRVAPNNWWFHPVWLNLVRIGSASIVCKEIGSLPLATAATTIICPSSHVPSSPQRTSHLRGCPRRNANTNSSSMLSSRNAPEDGYVYCQTPERTFNCHQDTLQKPAAIKGRQKDGSSKPSGIKRKQTNQKKGRKMVDLTQELDRGWSLA